MSEGTSASVARGYSRAKSAANTPTSSPGCSDLSTAGTKKAGNSGKKSCRTGKSKGICVNKKLTNLTLEQKGKVLDLIKKMKHAAVTEMF